MSTPNESPLTTQDALPNPAHGIPAAAAVPTVAAAAPRDFFSFGGTQRFFIDDQYYVEFAVMNEGAKAAYQKATNRPLRINTQTQEAIASVDPVKDRHELLINSLVGWNLTRGGQPYPFSPQGLRDFLQLADPAIVEKIEFAIQKANPWMNAEVSSEKLTEEINRLEILRDQALEREAGEGSSASK